MAGKRQHHLPQFLQRGFVSTADGKRTWLYRKGAEPRHVGLRDVGVEENFYTAETDSSVDETITRLEGDEFASAINRARTGSPGAMSDAAVFPVLIAHLEVRSRHLRTTFGKLAEHAWNDLIRNFEDPTLLAKLLREHLKRNPDELRAMAMRELRSKALPAAMAAAMAKQAAKLIRQMPDQVLVASFWEPIAPIIRSTLESRLTASVKQAHVDALRRSVAPDVRVQNYRKLPFHVVEVDSRDLILGDAAVLFHVQAEPHWKPFVDKEDELIAVYLPVTPHRVVVGSLLGARTDPSTLRSEIVRTSAEFFISHRSSPLDSALLANLGEAATPLSDADLRNINAQVIAECLPR